MLAPIGETFTLDRANWSPEDRGRVSLSAGFEGHMILVLGWAPETNWVSIWCLAKYAWTYLNKKSYVKIDSIGKVILNLLQPAYAYENRLQFQLQKTSANTVNDHVAKFERQVAAEREAVEQDLTNL